ncbi:Asp-tRNA(Asn)/Glu-tRNA(Gln) amidotransferase subunit GatC [bacterium SCSIO 12741]|nr:Asp-tRNA(Asn)/Glu-tRNA(Gln) amidotransferase subunit GatC [bacterium SCSIO 12741]
MEINEELIDRLAGLARLEFEGEEKKQVQNDLNRMLGFVEKLEEVNTDGVEPLIYMTQQTSHVREDKAEVTISKEDALKNAPLKDSDYFKVPKVLKK